MKIDDLLPELLAAKEITANSDEVTKGSIFVAIKGVNFDGNNFIDEALANGAAFILSEQEREISGAKFIKVENSKEALNFLATKIYNQLPANIIAVTGTSGKTSTVNMTREILINIGVRAASMGSLGIVGLGKEPIETGINTPDVAKLAKYMDMLAKHNIDYVAMEASSHGLALARVEEINYKAAAFTNLTQDHLDFHKNLDNYFASKMLLFNKYMQEGTAVINTDIPEYERILQICKTRSHKIISYGKGSNADLRIIAAKIDGSEQRVEFEFKGKKYNVTIPLFGEHQAYNLMASMGLVLSLGFDIAKIVAAIPAIGGIPGRMELVSCQDDKFIFIDYSHKPDPLEKALQTIRDLKRNKLIVVFGCGGDRDKEKRPQMGAIAGRSADVVIVTDDNPRTEDASKIRSEILIACPPAIEIANRKDAIKHAIALMESGDTLLIAGKGDEKYQIIGTEKIPFDEKKIILNCL